MHEKLDEIKDMIDVNNIDILCIQETWNIPSILDTSINGFHPLLAQQRKHGRGGGVGIYINDKIPITKIVSPFHEKYLETQAIEATIKRKKYIIINCYLGLLDKDLILNNLRDSLFTLKIKYPNHVFIVAGDFNIDLIRVGQDPFADKLLDIGADLELTSTFTCPTRVATYGTLTSVSCIDNMFTNLNMDTTKKYQLTIDISDHMPIIIEFKSKLTEPKISQLIRPITDAGMEKLEIKLLKQDWSQVYDCKNVDTATKIFEKIKDECINECLPEKTIILNKKHNSPWFTPGLKKSKSNLHKLRHIWLTRGHAVTKRDYYRYKKEYERISKIARHEYYLSNLKKKIGDSKQIWKLLDEVISRKKKGGQLSKLFNINGKLITDPEVISNVFNNQYADTGNNLAKKFAGDAMYEKYLRQEPTIFNLRRVSQNTVLHIISKIHNKKSHGHDALTNVILKKTASYLVGPLTHIINRSIATNTFPDSWKTTRVIPLFKGGDKLLTTNYRPISLSPVASKILEKVVNRQIFAYLNRNNILPTTQYGFRPKNQTNHLLLNFTNKLQAVLSKKQVAICAFLDFSKAFDTLCHKTIITKLKYLGFSETACNWFKSYLSNRFQYVEFSGKISALRAVTCGVPQGTCLGPLIFLLYTCDLKHHLTNSTSDSFADDTSITTIADTLAAAKTSAQEDYDILSDWYYQSRLSLNTGKTKIMIFGTNDNDITLTLQGNILEVIDEYKLVGITIDNKLSWKTHTSNVISRVRQYLGAMARAKKCLDKDTLLLMYNGLIRPCYNYGISFYGSAPQSLLKQLGILLKKCIRIICNLTYNTTTGTHFANLNLLKIDEEIKYARLLLMKTIYCHSSPTNVRQILMTVKKEKIRVIMIIL
jgi:hypothetical protein